MATLVRDRAFEAKAESIRLPDDVTLGFLVEHKLGLPLTRVKSFHSHLEALRLIPKEELKKQVCEALRKISFIGRMGGVMKEEIVSAGG